MKKLLLLFFLLFVPFVSATWPADYKNTWTTVGTADSIFLDANCMHSFDGFDFCWESDGTISILRDGTQQASSEFGMSGVSKGKAIYALSSDYVWDWNVVENSFERIEVEGKQVDYGKKDFKWKITLFVGRDSSLKIKNYVENTTDDNVTDLNFFYLFNVNTEVNPAVEYVGKDDNVKEFSLKDEKEEKGEKKEKFKGNHLRTDKKELKEIVNNISAPLFNFQFQDMIDSNYFLTYLYFGNLRDKKAKTPDSNGFIVGFSLTGGVLAVGQSYEIDPGIWLGLGDKGGEIMSLAVYDGNLFTGDDSSGIIGTYNSISNVWSSVKSFTFGPYSLAVYDGNLFTGHSDGVLRTYKNGIWSSLGDMGYGIYALAVYDGNLFTGQVGGTLGTYNSTSKIWTNLGVVDDSLYSLAVYDGNLYTGGASGVLGTYNSVSNVWFCYKYDDIWCDGDIGYVITSLAVYDGNLFTGQVDGILGTYNSASNKWSSLGDKGRGLSLAVYDGNLFTGDYDRPTQNLGGILGTYNSASNKWSSLGDKGADIISLAVYDRKLFTGHSDGVLGYYTTNLPSSFNILGDFNTVGSYIKGGTDHNVRFSISDVNGNTSDFLVDFNFSLKPVVGQGTVVVFKDLNLATAFVHDTNNLNLGFDINFYYLYSVGLLDANYFGCINLKNKAVDLNYGKCTTLSFMVDSTKPSTSWNKDTNYWYTTNQTVSLTCSDNNAGCQSTKYRYATLPGAVGSWTTYTTGVVFSDGKFHIDFNSTDRAVNIGDMNTKFLFVDTTKPVVSSDVNSSWNLIGDANLQMTAYDLTSGIDANWFRIDDNNSSARNWGAWQSFDRNILIDWARFGDGNFGVQYFSRDVARWDSNSDINSTTVYVLLDVNGPEWPITISPTSGSRTATVEVVCGSQNWIRDLNYVLEFRTNGDWNTFYNGPNSTYILNISWAVADANMGFRCKAIDADKNSGYFIGDGNITTNPFTGFDSIGSVFPSGDSTIYSASAVFRVEATDLQGVLYCSFLLWKKGVYIGDFNGVGPGGNGSGVWQLTYTSIVDGDWLQARDINCMDGAGNRSGSGVTTGTYQASISPPVVPPGGGGGGYPPIPLTVVGPGAPIIRIYPSTKKLELIAGITKNYSILIESLIDQDLNIDIVVPQSLLPYMTLVKKEDKLLAKNYVKWEWTVQSTIDLNAPINGIIEVFADKTPTIVDLQLAQAGGLSGILSARFFGLSLPTIIVVVFSLLAVVLLIKRERK